MNYKNYFITLQHFQYFSFKWQLQATNKELVNGRIFLKYILRELWPSEWKLRIAPVILGKYAYHLYLILSFQTHWTQLSAIPLHVSVQCLQFHKSPERFDGLELCDSQVLTAWGMSVYVCIKSCVCVYRYMHIYLQNQMSHIPLFLVDCIPEVEKFLS